MSKQKPLSKEEKKKRMKDLFNERKCAFLLKDLEKIAPKEKGIVVKTVEEVVKEMVDDSLIHTEKIGTSVYFWAFPSEDIMNKRVEYEKTKKLLEDAKKHLEEITISNEKLKKERSVDHDRESKLEEYEYLKQRQTEFKQQIETYADNDPEIIEKLEIQCKKSKEAVNRWTDNIYALQSYAKNKLSLPEKEINKGLNIPADLDYLE
ncbi:Meiotic coiled-coil protein [Entamoeba marina]